jgi:hypothetical protein
LRVLEAGRLDQLQLAIWKSALAGHLGAIDRVLRIMERRARLFGLDTPLLDVSTLMRELAQSEGHTPTETEQAVQEAERILLGIAACRTAVSRSDGESCAFTTACP